jgi:pyruvate dehydrogenase E2 component (dihydrolipoamide acetyltransferase)
VSTAVRMPNLGAEADEARVSSWLKSVGDLVMQGEVLAEVETEKATVDLEAPATGYLAEILVPAGAEAKVGTVLALLEQSVT